MAEHSEFGALLRDTIAELQAAEDEAAGPDRADPVERLRLDAAHRLVAMDGMPHPMGGVAAYRPTTEVRSTPPTLDLTYPTPPPPPPSPPKAGPGGRRKIPR